MTSLEETLSRPEFEIVDLAVDVEAVDRAIEAVIKGLVASDVEYGRKYRTTRGTLVAVVAPRPSDGGDAKTALAYRTAPASDSATRKATKVFEAVRDHTVEQ
jgi:hypothetical protein